MASNQFKSDNFIIIPGFAIADLKLSGNELICFSLIYGFTQDGETEFAGSLTYISSALNVTRRNAKAILDRLVDKNLVIRRSVMVNGVRLCRYQTINTPVVKTTTPLLSEQLYPVVETTTNTNTDTITDKIQDIKDKPKKFKKPTIEEVDSYCKERNNGISGTEFVNYYESRGWMIGSYKMKDWRAAVRTWESRRSDKPKTPTIFENQESDWVRQRREQEERERREFNQRMFEENKKRINAKK